MWLCRPVCVLPSRRPRRQFFLWRGSYFLWHPSFNLRKYSTNFHLQTNTYCNRLHPSECHFKHWILPNSPLWKPPGTLCICTSARQGSCPSWWQPLSRLAEGVIDIPDGGIQLIKVCGPVKVAVFDFASVVSHVSVLPFRSLATVLLSDTEKISNAVLYRPGNVRDWMEMYILICGVERSRLYGTEFFWSAQWKSKFKHKKLILIKWTTSDVLLTVIP